MRWDFNIALIKEIFFIINLYELKILLQFKYATKIFEGLIGRHKIVLLVNLSRILIFSYIINLVVSLGHRLRF